ncbi:MAG: hypothetical protein A3J54_00640 [Candidatus Ryanbacteria bacterium RIFCSPHIGHO2_02_FULL_45_13b]|uniref:SpoVT-AbrB domain-containing protein n=1 Tax=Candidatus Ryanbacteria bacterium RIFCSPHIGHO2_02_FULL_45_13b TaxID=1802117 RepID=A0A1G2G3L2_9BACT|nr:MAG: hypothetical protein A3J54_00640 [Candidatus Ryanbacteria bacterium RIFCSPHIGHO2_02_FULL_45_13b]
MIQKLLQIGSSVGVTVPKQYLIKQGLKVGDEVEISIKPARKVKNELLDWTDEFIKKYRPALEALSKK